MITKFLSKLKSILFKSEVSSLKEAKTSTSKTKKKSAKSSKLTKSKTKKDVDPKKIIEALKSIPGVGAKSAEAFYKAGFKTPKSIISAKEEDLLAIPGVGVNLVKKLKNLK